MHIRWLYFLFFGWVLYRVTILLLMYICIMRLRVVQGCRDAFLGNVGLGDGEEEENEN